MRPDYPSKIFIDKRRFYVLLMQTLAEDAEIADRFDD
jgi:hypothetical protein